MSEILQELTEAESAFVTARYEAIKGALAENAESFESNIMAHILPARVEHAIRDMFAEAE